MEEPAAIAELVEAVLPKVKLFSEVAASPAAASPAIRKAFGNVTNTMVRPTSTRRSAKEAPCL